MSIRGLQTLPSAIATLSVLFALHVPVYGYASRPESPELTQLLAAANDEATELAGDADEMQVLVNGDANWLSHALLLAKIKAHVDNMALIIDKLSKAQKSGSALQEDATNQMLSLVKQLSANTTAAINYLNQNKTRPTSEVYAEYLSRNAEAARQLSSMISSLIDYETSMEEIAKLKSKIGATSD
jgi:uncharacterized membrane protein YgaE (UPF0421/DUF939 family)